MGAVELDQNASSSFLNATGPNLEEKNEAQPVAKDRYAEESNE